MSSEITRPDVIATNASWHHLDIYENKDNLRLLGPFNGPYDVRAYAIDPEQPVVALYERSMLRGNDFLSQAAARLRRRGEAVANFVVAQQGVYAETVTEDEHGARLSLSAGYTRDANGTLYVFDQPDTPIPVTMVDISEPTSATMRSLTRLGIPMLRTERILAFHDKWLAKERMQEFGIRTPDARVHSLDDLEAGTAELPEHFVIKPREGMIGTDVHIFDEGMDDARFTQALREMRRFYSDALVENYVEPMTLRRKGIDGDAAFNVRVITFNGYCGAFARIHGKSIPGNVYQGAQAVSLPKLKQSLRRQKGFDPDDIQQRLEDCAERVGQAFPDTLLGFDAMLDADGEVHVIEVNLFDFGAFNKEAFSERDWWQGLERTVRNISEVARRHRQPPPVQSDGTSPYSLVDSAEGAYLKYAKMVKLKEYRTEDGGRDYARFYRKNRAMMWFMYEAFEKRRLEGDVQHCYASLGTIHEFAKRAGMKRLTERTATSLSKMAIDRLAHDKD